MINYLFSNRIQTENHATPGYLTYGYDEFGNDLSRELEESGIPSPYDRQGEEQPFGYTGYRYDDISGTYFAQAREYQPESGRFTAEDVMKGNGAVPETLNRYGYCWGNPVGLVDLDGLYPAWLDGIFAHIQFETEVMAEYWALSETDENISVSTNMFIPFGGLNGARGFADVAIHYYGTTHIYEIKPQSHYNDVKKRSAGEAQLQGYVDAYDYFCFDTIVQKGEMQYVETLLYIEEPFVFDKSRNIVYRMYADSPGMIYYEFRDRGREEQEEDSVMSSEEEKVYKDAQLAVAWSILNHSGVLESMIEDPDSDDWFSALFSPEAIMKAIFGGNVPIGIGGGTCPVFA